MSREVVKKSIPDNKFKIPNGYEARCDKHLPFWNSEFGIFYPI